MMGFTKQELHIAQFLLFSLLLGSGVKIYKHYFNQDELPQVDAALVEEFELRSALLVPTPNGEKPDQGLIAVAEATAADTKPDKKVLEAGDPEKTKTTLSTGELKIDINRAGSSELQQVPKIGPVLAKRILSYRETHGEFKSVDDLLQVSGIGPKTLESIVPYIVLK